jgi:DNA-binding NarL/FixJ family response regulator
MIDARAGVHPDRPRCLMVGRYAALLDTLRRHLEPEFEVRITAADLQAAVAAAATFRPDAAIIDLDASDMGMGIARHLCKTRPGLAVTYLTSETDPPWCPTAVSKARPAAEFLRAVRTRLHRPAEASNGVRSQPPGQSKVRPAAILTDRERQVLTLLVRGLCMKQVAYQLGIAPRTVAFHKYKAMEANGLRNNVDLMAFALHHGLLAPRDQPRN